MKKFLSMLVALSLIAPAVLVGCGEEKKAAPKKVEPAKGGEKKEEKKAEPAKAPEAPKAEEKKAPEAPKAPEKK
jgi:hypothetical protein